MYKKILITGGSGFIGSNFIRAFLHKYGETTLINLDCLSCNRDNDNLRDVEDTPRYQFVKGDICDPEIVDELMKQVDAVINFAAESHVDRSIIDSAPFVRSNVLGTQVLLDAALKNNIKKFYQISTDEVFGSLGGKGYFSESSPYNPQSPYSATKAAADHLVRAYHNTHKLPVIISNCSNNYGPYQYPEKIIPLFITNLLRGKKVPLYSTGANIRDWLHVDDHCEAIDLILHEGRIGETYVIGGNCEIRNMDLTEMILKEMGFGKEMIERVPDRKGHDFRYAIDFSKIKKELGWQPQRTFQQGLRETIQWYRQNEVWWRNKV